MTRMYAQCTCVALDAVPVHVATHLCLAPLLASIRHPWAVAIRFIISDAPECLSG
jgi:hypothetical protein